MQFGRRSFYVTTRPSGTVVHHTSVVDISVLVENVYLHKGLRTPLRTFVEEYTGISMTYLLTDLLTYLLTYLLTTELVGL